LVLGLDPGRACIATIRAQLTDDPKTLKKWTLTRNEYYSKADLKAENVRSAKAYACLKGEWDEMRESCSVRTAKPDEVVKYVKLWGQVAERWQAVAFDRKESRARFRATTRKRAVLDGFFAAVREDAEKLSPSVTLAYGSAGLKMKPTGKREVAVPTAGSYKAAVRIFGKSLAVVDEFRTTAFSWSTLERTQKVHSEPLVRRVDRKGVVHLDDNAQPTEGKRPPTIAEESLEAVQLHIKRRQNRAFRATGMRPRASEYDRYPEIRGLRFCPKHRRFTDRDGCAALTIARLHCLERAGLPRPAAFCRGQPQSSSSRK
jgi:hypothetical protein